MNKVKSPSHYTVYPVQPIEITKHLGFCLGNVVKYVLRAPFKDDPALDLKKALQYLDWEKENPQDHIFVHELAKVFAAIIKLLNHFKKYPSTPDPLIVKDTVRFLNALNDYVIFSSQLKLKEMESSLKSMLSFYEKDFAHVEA